MKLRYFMAIAAGLFITGAALADYQVRDGNGNLTVIKAVTLAGGAVLPQSVPSDSAGTALFSTGNPGVVAPAAPASAGDAASLTNVFLTVPGLFNGSTLDRARSATGDGLATTGMPAAARYLWNGTSYDRARSATGSTGITPIDSESVKATCRGAFAFAPAASPTDVLVLQGSASKTMRVRRIIWSGYGTAGVLQVSLVRRSAANTGGTSATVTLGKADTNDGACTGVLTTYTANPSGLGTAVATLYNSAYGINASNSGAQDRLTIAAGDEGGKAFVLRGTSDYLAINLNGAGALTNAYGTVVWTEE